MSSLFPELDTETEKKSTSSLFPELDTPAKSDLFPELHPDDKSDLFPELHAKPTTSDGVMNGLPGVAKDTFAEFGRKLAGDSLHSLGALADFALRATPAYDPEEDGPASAAVAPLAEKVNPGGVGLKQTFSDFVAPTEGQIVDQAGKTGQVPYGKIVAKTLADSFMAATPTDPVEAAAFYAGGHAIGESTKALLDAAPELGKSLSDLLFRKKVIVPIQDLPAVTKAAAESFKDALVGTPERTGTTAEAHRAAIQTFEQEAAKARTARAATAQAGQGAPDMSGLPSTEAPGGIPATELSVPGKVQRNAQVVLDDIKRAMGVKPEAPIETPGATLPDENVPHGDVPHEPVIPTKGSDYLNATFPELANSIEAIPKSMAPDLVKGHIIEATAQAEAALLSGASTEQAQQAAINHIQEQVQAATPAPKPIKYDNKGLPMRKPGSVVSTIDVGADKPVKITHQQVINEAKALLQDELAQREISPLEQFVHSHGGVKGYKGGMESEEFKDVPIHLRGAHSVDEMAQMAFDRGLLEEPSGDALRNELRQIKKRGPEPQLNQFYDRALQNLEYYAQEGVYSGQHSGEPAAFEQGQLYNVPGENVTQRYERLKKEALAQGMNPFEAIKHAKDQMKAAPAPAAGIKPTQQEFDAGGVQSFGGGRAGEQELFEPRSPYQQELPLDGSPPKPLPIRPINQSAFAVKFKKTGKLVVPGQKVTSPEDLAFIFKAISDPAKENFFAAMIKDGHVVAVEHLGIGTVDQVAAYPLELLNLISHTGADSVVIAHNHPSGHTDPSDEDKRLTRTVRKIIINNGQKFLGHVIINDTKFGFINGDGTVEQSQHAEYKDTKTVDVLEKYGEWIGTRPTTHGALLESAKSAFELFKGIQTGDSEGMAFLLNPQKELLNAIIIPHGQFTPKIIQNLAAEYRAKEFILVNSKLNPSQMRELLWNVKEAGITILDNIITSKDSGEASYRSTHTELAEPRAKYGAQPSALQKQAIDEFGETKDLSKAGFLFPNGKMVDFARGGGARLYSHHDAIEQMTKNKSNLYDFMGQTKALRVVHYSDMNGQNLSFQSMGPLSSDQVRQIRDYMAENKVGHSNLERIDEGGRTVGSTKSVDNTTIEDVTKFFNGSSELAEKHAQYGDSAPSFYSMVEKTITDKMPARSTGDQVAGLLRNAPGIKQEELDWMGLPEFLKGKKSVTKEEVQNFIRENNVQIKEVVKGDLPLGIRDGKNGWEVFDSHTQEVIARGFETWDEASRAANQMEPAAKDQTTKFEKYTLPGGENYRELLLTFPEKPLANAPELNWKKNSVGYEANFRGRTFRINPEGDHFYAFEPDGLLGSAYENIEQAKKGVHNFLQNPQSSQGFRSGHFTEPNILTHIRFNDRVDASGKKVLFIEEIQSDWHQKGRQHGYAGEQLSLPAGWKFKTILGVEGREIGVYDDRPALMGAGSTEQEALQRAIKRTEPTVPDAPFKKTWHELALKRMLRYATENGYDSVAWTTGEQQAERYDLSKQVDSIEVHRRTDAETGEKTRAITLRLKKGMPSYIEAGVGQDGIIDNATQAELGGKPLSELVGKEMAEKIMASDLSKPNIEFHGGDLKIGGEGMKGFYDQIVPAFLNKYTKKWGGRVGETNLNLGEIQDSDSGQTFPADQSTKVHSLDITPSMKESVNRQGQALFEGKAPYGDDKGISERLKEASTEIKNIVNPSSAAPLASAIMREQLGKMARSFDKAEAALSAAHEFFEAQSVANNTDFIDRMEKGEPQPGGALQKIADILRAILDSKRDEVQSLGSGKLKSFIENYFPHIWDQSEGTVSKAAQVMSKRPLEGRKSFLKKRKIEFFKDGIEMGLTPASYNPIDLTFLKIREMDKYIMAHRTLNVFKDEGLTQFVKLGKDAPDGWIKINDSISTVMRPIEADGKLQGLAIVGHYYAQPDAARLINNYLSPGLQKSQIYQGFRYAGNLLNQLQLGLSAFHLGFTSVDAAVSKFALAINQLAEGRPLSAIKVAIQTPLAPITNIIQGDKLLKAWYGKSGSQFDMIIANAMEVGGGRARMDQFYATKAWDQMKKLFKSGHPIKGILNVPLALAEISSKPILEYVVPRQKLGVFSDIIKMELENHPDMTAEELRSVAQKAWDSVDNRMGQLVYDNIFWNRTFKDLLMASVRSVGWNLGTIREVGGGIKDLGEFAYKKARGEKAKLSYRTQYIVALPIIAGILGAMYQYLRTGKGPQELKDLYFPRTGAIDANGDPVRVSLPTYMKDLYHYSQAPLRTILNKTNPTISILSQMFENKDFYGVKIRNEDDPLVQQAMNEVKFALKQALPFGIRNVQKNMESKKDLRDMVEPFIGITPAPYDVNQTKAEGIAHRIAAGKIPLGGRTQEEADRSKLLKDFSKRIKEGDAHARVELYQAMREHKVTPKQVADLNRNIHLTPLQKLVKSFTAEEIKRVYAAATPEEKKEIEHMYRSKMANARMPVTRTQ